MTVATDIRKHLILLETINKEYSDPINDDKVYSEGQSRLINESESMEIAKTILQQLGGNKFKIMTGADKFTALKNGLQFSFKGCNKCNKLVITLMPSDTYKMSFYKMPSMNAMMQGKEPKLFTTVDDVYVDLLQQTFTTVTGLDTKL